MPKSLYLFIFIFLGGLSFSYAQDFMLINNLPNHGDKPLGKEIISLPSPLIVKNELIQDFCHNLQLNPNYRNIVPLVGIFLMFLENMSQLLFLSG